MHNTVDKDDNIVRTDCDCFVGVTHLDSSAGQVFASGGLILPPMGGSDDGDA